LDKAFPLEIVKINDSAYRIEDDGVRCFLFIGSASALLVDTCRNQTGSLKAVIDSLTDKPVMLVNTHSDWDHISDNASFGPAHMHPAEMSSYVQNAKQATLMRPLWEADWIDIGGQVFEVVLIPGHTPGSIALLDRANKILLTGDSISGGNPIRHVVMFGEKRNFDAFIVSLEKLLELERKNAFDTIYPSHGQFPLSADTVESTYIAAKKFIAGELSPSEPPVQIPAKLYEYNGAAFYA